MSIGAGTGADTATFKKLGCKVILVEPNADFLDKAKINMAKIEEGEAVIIFGIATETNINGIVDLM